MGKLKHEDILDDPDFKDLSRQKFIISTVLTILELVLYFGFIGLIAFRNSNAVPPDSVMIRLMSVRYLSQRVARVLL
jgi:uncharacterized membrane protein (DUF485 family)